jgi:D-inositol-3-phosphate glycosyltransferase
MSIVQHCNVNSMHSKVEVGRLPLVIIGQYVPTSGLTCVMQNLIAHLKDKFDISVIGLCYDGPPFVDGAKTYPDILNRRPDGSQLELGAFLSAAGAKIALLFHDLPVQPGLLNRLEAAKCHPKIVTYTAVDGNVIEHDLLWRLGTAERSVFSTEFGRSQAAKFIGQRKLAVIPLGVDTNLFYPYSGSVAEQFAGSERRNARRVLFGDQSDLLDAFIVLNGNRPWLRKRIDLTVEGFALFARNKPASVKLYLHHARTSEFERRQVFRMARRWNIVDRLIVNPMLDGKSEVSNEQLNLLYNSCDVGINTSMGEGWGLVSFEHAATGAPQIVPRHSACSEIWQDAADFLEPNKRDIFLCAPHCEMEAISPDDVANILERLYQEPDYRRNMALAAYRRVTEPRFRWSSIASQWVALFDEIVDT